MKTETKVTRDPALYRRLSEPFDGVEAAQVACDGFFEELRALREKWRLRDVLAVAQFSMVVDGDEREVMLSSVAGRAASKIEMAAFVYGEARVEHEAMVEATQRTGEKLARKR